MRTFSLLLAGSFLVNLQAAPSRAQPAKGEPKGEETIQIYDQLTPIDAVDMVTGNPHKVHVLKMQAGKTYLITLVRKDDKQGFNPYLRIEDSSGKQVLTGNANLKVRVKFSPVKDDTYRLIATSFGGIGEYILKIGPTIPVQVIKEIEPAKVYEIGKAGIETTARLTDKDPRDKVRQGMFSKVVLVKLVKDRTYSIDMISTQFDAFLRLEDMVGKQLAQDDDSGGSLNALIVFRAPSNGTYRIIATSFAPNAQGQFLLRAQEE